MFGYKDDLQKGLVIKNSGDPPGKEDLLIRSPFDHACHPHRIQYFTRNNTIPVIATAAP